MSKFISFIFPLAIFVCFSATAFGQTERLKNDLNRSFRKFEVVRVASQSSAKQLESQNRLSIKTAEKDFQLELTPRDLRSADYRAEDITVNGTRTLKDTGVVTFKGKVNGAENSEVRLLVDGAKVEGYFVSEGKRYFIEPARRHSEFASGEDMVVYREGDLYETAGYMCHSDIGEKLERGKEFVMSKNFETVSGMRILKIATDADFEYVTATGGAAATNNEILGILNMVEGLFENEVNLKIRVVYQNTWSIQDPYNGTSAQTLLNSFRDHWNLNFTHIARDVAHLWTAKPSVLQQGFAFVGVICRTPSAAYGLSGRIEWEQPKYLIAAHELGHNLGANHAEEAQSCGNTLMNAQLSVVTPLTFCSLSRSEVSNFVTANGSCLEVQSSAKARFDFDRDGRSDIAVFRPSNGVWYIMNSGGGYNIFQFGQNGDLPVSADFDGDGKSDAAVFRAGVWYILRSSNGSFDGISFGIPTDIPTPADFDGDGKADVAVFRPSNGTWFILNSSSGSLSAMQFGADGDVPMPGDYNGDGKADVNVFRPSNGVWYRINSGSGSFFAAQFGQNGDKPVSGDFDGDGKYDLAVFRPANGAWYISNSSNGSLTAAAFGTFGDIPSAADFDGDGKTDMSVFRPSTGEWFRMNSSSNSFAAAQFGIATDKPVQSYYVR